MPELELKAIADLGTKIGADFDNYKKKNDERLSEIEKKGLADPLLKEEIAKTNKALSDLVAEKDKLVLKVKAMVALAKQDTGNGDIDVEETAEAKARYRDFLVKGANVKSNGELEFHDAKYIPKRDAEGKLERKAMSVVSDPDGGYMVTADMNGRMIKKLFETSDLRRVASVQAIGTDALEGINDLGEAGYGWVGETAARPATTTPQIGKWRIPVHEMYAMPIVTQKLLDDSNFNPEQWLADKLADRFARAENDAFANGTTDVKPRGFLTYAAGTSGTASSQIEQVNSGGAGTFAADTLMDLIGALKTQYRRTAEWGMHRLSVVELRQLKDSQNRYLWDPGLNGPTQQNILSFPINEFNDVPIPAANALAITLADWKEFYQIVDRVGIRVLRDPFTNKPYVQFYATKRTGGAVLNFEAGKIYKLAV